MYLESNMAHINQINKLYITFYYTSLPSPKKKKKKIIINAIIAFHYN